MLNVRVLSYFIARGSAIAEKAPCTRIGVWIEDRVRDCVSVSIGAVSAVLCLDILQLYSTGLSFVWHSVYCASDSALLTTVRVYKLYLLTYLLTYFVQL